MSRRSRTHGRGDASAPVVVGAVREIANGGDGVVVIEHAGERRAVFVRGAALEDELEIRVDLSTRPARGRLVRVVHPGPARIAPACVDAARCGGCAWMHLSTEGQLDAHRRHLRETLAEPWRDVPRTLHPPAHELGYRTRARLHARASRGRAIIGMLEAGTHDPVAVDRCVILHPAIERARLELGALLEGARGRGEARLALGASGAPVLELVFHGRLAPATFARLEEGVASGRWSGARVFEGDVRRPAIVGDPCPITRGADGGPLRLAPGGFAQASEAMGIALGERLVALCAHALQRATPGSLGGVVELYAGAGHFTVLLARHAERLVTVEADEPACIAARQNLAARGLTAKVVHGRAEELPIPRGTDLVILDPPRTGARDVVGRLVSARPDVIAYVSCDLPTLARDLALLHALYEPVALEAFAMFPQTPHLEVIAVVARRRGDRPPARGRAP